MNGQEKITRGYTITVRNPVDTADGYHALYAPRTSSSNGDQGPTPFEAVARIQGEEIVIEWVNLPKDTEGFELDAPNRVRTLHGWLSRLTSQLASVETWMKDLDWSTRRIEKSLEDSHIGHYNPSVA